MLASRPVLVLAVLAALTGGALSGCASAEPGESSREIAAPVQAATGAPGDTGKVAGFQDPAPNRSSSDPTRIRIPSIGVSSPLEHLARDGKGGLRTPKDAGKAGWYADGTVPGQVGPAIIAGHLDGSRSAGVFAELKRLRPKDRIVVELKDGTTVRFAVTRTETVSRYAFPAYEVYGPTRDPELRLITCAGRWDGASRTYSHDLLVYATEEP